MESKQLRLKKFQKKYIIPNSDASDSIFLEERKAMINKFRYWLCRKFNLFPGEAFYTVTIQGRIVEQCSLDTKYTMDRLRTNPNREFPYIVIFNWLIN